MWKACGEYDIAAGKQAPKLYEAVKRVRKLGQSFSNCPCLQH